MKKVFHKLRDYVLALLALMTISACRDSLNTLYDPHFTEEGTLVKKPSFAKLDYNSIIHFYIESSGSMNGFFMLIHIPFAVAFCTIIFLI